MKLNNVLKDYRQRLIISLFLTFLFLWTSQGNAYDLESRVKKFTLNNGLRILVVERHISPTVSLYIRYNVGAADENSEHTGTAHLLEHMLFKGTETIGTKNYTAEKILLEKLEHIIAEIDREKIKKVSDNEEKINDLMKRYEEIQHKAKAFIVENEIDHLYTENGGTNLNASTGYDLTTYHVDLPSNKVELWARIESDRMRNPVFREFLSERNVVIEERRQTIASYPQRQLMELYLATAFLVHPYRRPIIGWSSDMQYLNLEYMREFFKAYHAPNNTVIAVVGDVSTSDIEIMITKYFGDIPSQDMPLKRISEEPKQQGERRVALVYDANPQMIIGFHKPTLPSFDDYVFDVINIILSDGRTSRFFKNIVQGKKIAADIRTANGFPGAKYPNQFTIFATPRHPYTNADVESAIYEELGILGKEPASQKELQKAIKKIQSDLINALSSNSGLASMLSYFEAVAGDYRYITRNLDIIKKVTALDIMKVAKTYFCPENRTVATLIRKEP